MAVTMMDYMLQDSDGELGSDHPNSSQSTSTSSSSGCGRCSSMSRSSSARLSTTTSPAPTVISLSSTRKPHSSSSDPKWAAIARRNAPLGPSDFRLLRCLSSGDIGTVYLCHLHHDSTTTDEGLTPLLFAMKVVDKKEVERKKKLGRAEAERAVLRLLDHPFLPTLYADFDAAADGRYSCVVMEFCGGGDLHTLRHRQPLRRFPPAASRFYAAEVLMALEYLHMLGVVYRDLKPENVLIRSDGHIMLSDFDLSLQSTSSPSVVDDSCPPTTVSPFSPASPDSSRNPSCFPTRIFSRSRRTKDAINRRLLGRLAPTAEDFSSRTRFVAEPVDARSGSFVGTHEYVSPEVASGSSHGAAVDWWAFGIFLYELLHGRTPFVGHSNEATLRNIVKQPLAFPPSPAGAGATAEARDLISRLLVKDPSHRLGSVRGAADVKAHPFFADLNFALLRSQRPPFVPATHTGQSKSYKERPGPDRFDSI